MTETETPAALLRRAAEHLWVLAGEATPGPWRAHDTHLGQYGHAATVLSGERNSTELRAWLPSMSQEPWDQARNVWADAAWIAVMHPGVGVALAGLFAGMADHLDASGAPGGEPLLRVARVVLGEVASCG